MQLSDIIDEVNRYVQPNWRCRESVQDLVMRAYELGKAEGRTEGYAIYELANRDVDTSERS